MSSVMVPRKTKEGWIIDLAPDFAEALGVAEGSIAVSYTHLRAHETVLDIVCRLLLEKKNQQRPIHELLTCC